MQRTRAKSELRGNLGVLEIFVPVAESPQAVLASARASDGITEDESGSLRSGVRLRTLERGYPSNG